MTITARVRTRSVNPAASRPGGVSFRIAVGVLLFVVLAVFVGPLVYPVSPTSVDLGAALQGISWRHPLGTDSAGRDLLARTLAGGRETLLAPLVATAFATVVGTLLGVVAGWYSGASRVLIQRFFDAIFAFPSILLAILLVTIMGRGIIPATLAMTVGFVPFIGQLALNVTRQEKEKPYVSAYRVLGFRESYIASRHVVPNIAPLILSQSTVYFGYGIMVLGSISYLGFGVQPPAADWGRMVADGQVALLAGGFLPSLVPGIAMVIVVICVSIIGETFADRIARRRSR